MCNLRILIRRSLDWDNASYDDLLNPSIRRVAELWDRSFTLPYVACRARIKAITRDSLQALPNVRVEEAHDIGLSGALEQQPPLPVEKMFFPDDLVLISDDDDIYHPGILEILQDAPWRDHILMWPDCVFGPRPAGYVIRRPVNVRNPMTNNYSASGNMLVQNAGLLHGLLSHDRAMVHIAQRRALVHPLEVPPMSLVNRHPCSITVMQNSGLLNPLPEGEGGCILRALVQQYVDFNNISKQQGLEWCAGYISLVQDVFREALGLNMSR